MVAQKRKPANILVCHSGDLFGEWIPTEWILKVFDACEKAPWHNYLFITMNPKRYNELLQKGMLVTVLPQALNKKTVAIADLCSTYAVQVIAGQKNLTTDWDALVKSCEDEGLEQIYQTYAEAVESYGLLTE